MNKSALTLLLVLVLARCAPPAMALEVVDGKAVLSEQEQASLQLCAAQGGCHIVSQAAIQSALDEITHRYHSALRTQFEQAVTIEALKVCKNVI